MNKSNDNIINLSNTIKMLSACAVEKAKSGHPGTPVGASELMAVLFAKHVNINPNNPSWDNRDRFILSAGHACAMLYSILHLFGYKKFDLESIKNLRQLHYITSGHPEFDIEAGIEVTTGPLGEGVSMAVGMAIAERVLNSRFSDISNHYTYVFVGDGCLMEGVSYEALSLAGNLNLNKLIIIYDNNNITIDGELSLSSSENIALRMEAMGFYVQNIDGHDLEAIDQAILSAKKSTKPSFIIAKTLIAHKAGEKEGKEISHGSPLGKDSIQALKENINWTYADFEIPENVKIFCATVVSNNVEKNKKWDDLLSNSSQKLAYESFIKQKFSDDLQQKLQNLADETLLNKPNIATRVASGKVLEIITSAVVGLIGGSADLSSSNNTIHKNSNIITKDNYNGNYIHYGVREHAMAAIMNGISCYSRGFIPYGGTFLVFSDFMRPAIRLSALMERQVIYVFTHDNISLGADGPTHQPIEHIESLRLIPNTALLRPCDMIETIECYNIALSKTTMPTIMVLGRANVPTLRGAFNSNNNLSAKGGYIFKEHKDAIVNLIASGSDLHLVVAAADMLEYENIYCNIISMPYLSAFAQQEKSYKDAVLGNRKTIVIGTSTLRDYKELLGNNPIIYGINSFGKSGSPEEVMHYFGFTKEAIKAFIQNNL